MTYFSKLLKSVDYVVKIGGFPFWSFSFLFFSLLSFYSVVLNVHELSCIHVDTQQLESLKHCFQATNMKEA